MNESKSETQHVAWRTVSAGRGSATDALIADLREQIRALKAERGALKQDLDYAGECLVMCSARLVEADDTIDELWERLGRQAEGADWDE